MDEQLNGEQARATTQEVTFEPGAASAPHRHPSPVFGYVLEGDLEFQAGDVPARRLTSQPFPFLLPHACLILACSFFSCTAAYSLSTDSRFRADNLMRLSASTATSYQQADPRIDSG